MRHLLLFTLLALFELTLPCQAEVGDFSYSKANKSFIEWETIKEREFLDFTKWKEERNLKDDIVDWKLNRLEKKYPELVGRVLACFGECKIYRGEGGSTARFQSQIVEGDELFTGENSMLWSILLDGTMVRLSGKSSLSLKEINISKEDVFYHARLNQGEVYWIPRSKQPFKVSEERETDTLFTNLPMLEVYPKNNIQNGEGDLLARFTPNATVALKQFERLNYAVEENNQKLQKRKSFLYMVLPNGTFYGESLFLHAISLLGNSSYVKALPLTLYHEEEEMEEIKFAFRGYDNTDVASVPLGEWQKVEADGKSIAAVATDEMGELPFGEIIISRIPTLMLAREYFVRDFGRILTEEKPTRDIFAQNYGYRIWEPLKNEKGDLSQRLNYLTDYIRRIETTQLLVASKFRARQIESGDITDNSEYSDQFYRLSLLDYYQQGQINPYRFDGKEQLHSTTRNFWKLINGVK